MTEGSKYDINAFKNPSVALVASRAPRRPPYHRADSGPQSPAEGACHAGPFHPPALPAFSPAVRAAGPLLGAWSITIHLATLPVLTAAGSRPPGMDATHRVPSLLIASLLMFSPLPKPSALGLGPLMIPRVPVCSQKI